MPEAFRCTEPASPQLQTPQDSIVPAEKQADYGKRVCRPGANTPMTADVQRLVKLAEAAELFRTADGDAYVTVPVQQHHEHWPVRSKAILRVAAAALF